MNDFDPLHKLPKNGEDWGKLIVAKGYKGCPKSKISPNLVTLILLDVLLLFPAFTFVSKRKEKNLRSEVTSISSN